ncbi:putative membrane protein [Acinetobacter sp. 1592897]|nr:putative membrane protein [Acinetobacter sp. 1592897]
MMSLQDVTVLNTFVFNIFVGSSLVCRIWFILKCIKYIVLSL